MGIKAQFNHETRIIDLIEVPASQDSILEIDVQTDLYSDAKEDWLVDPNLNKLVFPFDTIGGDDLGSEFAGRYFFLRNDLGWRIKPYPATHQMTIIGNLYARDPNLPLALAPDADVKVLIILERAALSFEAKSVYTDADREELTSIRPYISPLYSKL